jgi:hypothetical protein
LLDLPKNFNVLINVDESYNFKIKKKKKFRKINMNEMTLNQSILHEKKFESLIIYCKEVDFDIFDKYFLFIKRTAQIFIYKMLVLMFYRQIFVKNM